MEPFQIQSPTFHLSITFFIGPFSNPESGSLGVLGNHIVSIARRVSIYRERPENTMSVILGTSKARNSPPILLYVANAL